MRAVPVPAWTAGTTSYHQGRVTLDGVPLSLPRLGIGVSAGRGPELTCKDALELATEVPLRGTGESKGTRPIDNSLRPGSNEVSRPSRSILRNGALAAVFAASLACVSSATADWLVLRNGARSEVRAVQIRERFIVAVTLNDKTWSLALESVDVETTRALNGMSEMDELSPGWPRPDAPADVVTTARTVPEANDRRPNPPGSQTGTEPPTPAAPPPHTSPPPQLEGKVVRSVEDGAETRLALFLNGVTESSDFALTESRSFSIFKETATLDVNYRGSNRSGYEVGALVRIRGPVGIVASAELFDTAPSATYRNRLPHPFFYDRLRELSGEQPDLSWSERAVHVDPVLSLDFGPRLSVDAFSGVSMFFTETELVDEILYEEVFPYDSLVSKGTTFRRMEARPLGYNLGVSTTLRLLGVLGVNFGLRYSRAEVRLDLAEGRETHFEVGGLRFGAGLRILIP